MENSSDPLARLAIALAAAILLFAPVGAQVVDPLAVMSFNIRYGTARDGDNHWDNRREMVFNVLRSEDADVVGLQEALAFQIDEIVAAVPGYGVVGVGRDDGRRAGEFSAILFKRERFSVAEAGTFWLSDTPGVIASATWGNSIPRICTWARFVDRDGRGVWHFNVHLDHQSQPSRERSAALLLERISQRSDLTEPVVVTGDFNAGEDNPAIARLTSPTGTGAPPFVDSFRLLHPDETIVGTFTGFALDQTAGVKIDYVFVQPGTEVLEASIVRTIADGRYPSDHFPVTARIQLPGGAPAARAGRTVAERAPWGWGATAVRNDVTPTPWPPWNLRWP